MRLVQLVLFSAISVECSASVVGMYLRATKIGQVDRFQFIQMSIRL